MMNKKLLLGGVLFAFLTLLFLTMAGVFTPKISEQESKVQALNHSAGEIETATLTAEVEAKYREFPGVVVANQKAKIAARITATVVEVLVEVGTVVQKGDVVLRLENDDLDAKVRQSQQALSSAQAKLNAARNEYRRMQELLVKKLIPQSQYDQAESTLKTAQANWEHARATISEAETLLGFSVITAPFDGIVTRKAINQGDTATPGSELLSIYNPDSLVTEVNVPESLLPLLSIGKSLDMYLPTYQTETTAQIKEVTPAADQGSRSYLVRLSFEPKVIVYPGSYAKVALEVEQQTVLRVPPAAVYQVGQLDYVRVVEGGEIKTRLVQLADNLRVRKGLKSGDVVVLNPTVI